MKNKILLGLAILVLVAAGWFILPRLMRSPDTSPARESAAASYYTCPMHPTVKKDSPGACPVCGMSLVKVEAAPAEDRIGSQELTEVTLSPARRVLANVATAEASRRSLRREIRGVGTIDYAEPNKRRISIRFPGRLERLYLTYTGQNVKEGDPVADVYSPEAISAQEEYLLAKDSYDGVVNEAEIIASAAKELSDRAREKLVRWDFTAQQISALEQTHEIQTILTIHSPISGTVTRKNVDPQHYAVAGEDLYEVADLSTVWMYIDIYENEIPAVKAGQRIEATTDAFPGKTFTGVLKFVSPTIDPSSRTVRVRAEFSNQEGALKIGMFVNATIVSMTAPGIVVPASAVLSLGARQVVWIQTEPGVFEPRAVRAGARSGDSIQILEGVSEGETVVASGGYLLDSESQLQTGSAGSGGGDSASHH